MAAYSVFCYLLHIKDRHNGNIMLCSDGAVAHVDFGIMLNVDFDGMLKRAFPEMKIKLSHEFVQVMEGAEESFEGLCVAGYLAIRKHAPLLLSLLHTSRLAGAQGLPCLEGDAVEQLERRLALSKSDADARLHMIEQLEKAKENKRTEILDMVHNFTHANIAE
eukprot:CAMPEP_0181311138 /NCGR_PEP_ID=MMETSP1101-20121128/12969_1 /TAXON_ID=46948 /ORGANISM="Rhodomonas abbreviata, Strain Caron Lab Isolate" /LENGTH=162 /DNA_ID=CAMNT_0023417833 /DNA_START=90 /DNA_END=578 /DNA_ORIENTATION=-